MDKNGMNADKNNQLKLINALSREASINILLELCKDDDLAKRIFTMSKTVLSEVEADVVSDEVFNSLNSIQVVDLWDNSGKTRAGYNDPVDVAYEMIEDEIRRYIRNMEQYKNLGMKNEEKEYCKGIISGLMRYGNDGNNEFRDWCPDDPYTVADNILYDWKNAHTAEETKEIQEVYDNFYFEEENE